MVDLLTVGETMLRLSVPSGKLLSDAAALEVSIGGAESNVAVAVARLGYRSRWLSRLPDNSLGHRVADEIARYGVDCSAIAWTAEDRLGTYYLEFGVSQRPTRAIYDRANSAASKMGPETFDLSQIEQARMIHLTGITPALSDSCYALVGAVIDRANTAKIPIVFDVNHRARLWSSEECARKVTPFLKRVDTLVVARRDATSLFQIDGTPADMLRALHDRFGAPHVVMTLAEIGAIGLSTGTIYEAPGYRATLVDRIGAGDAFAAGVICGLLEEDFGLGLEYGVAMSALKLGLHGDLFRLTRADVLQLMADRKDSLDKVSR